MTGYTSELTHIDKLLIANQAPPEKELRNAVRLEAVKFAHHIDAHKRRPDTLRLIVAAALLNDATLYADVVAYDYAADKRSYHRQKDDGMPEVDLGPEPSLSASAARLGTSARCYLDGMPENIKGLILPRLETFEAGHRVKQRG